jgi:hypothetical protein
MLQKCRAGQSAPLCVYSTKAKKMLEILRRGQSPAAN